MRFPPLPQVLIFDQELASEGTREVESTVSVARPSGRFCPVHEWPGFKCPPRPSRTPQVFRSYCKDHGLAAGKTASCISVQCYRELDRALREAKVMVFRLGGEGGGTQFGLVRAEADLEGEFFLKDRECFQLDSPPSTFVPEVGMNVLYPFQLLGSIEEVGAVNLAVASGLLGYALGLEDPRQLAVPATGASTYTFDVVPHANRPVQWTHRNGQVQIDCVLLAKRKGRWTLFVVEAKHGRPGDGVAKHKLAYPAFVLGSKPLPPDILVVPVYLRSWQERDIVLFGISECSFNGIPTRPVSALSSCAPAPVYGLPLKFLGG